MSRPKQVDVAGVLVDSEAEAVRLVEAQLHGVGPWSAKTDSTDADGLERVDLAWLLAHARNVVPQRALGGTLIGMQDTAARVALVRALAPWTQADKQAALAGPFWAIMKDAAEVRLGP